MGSYYITRCNHSLVCKQLFGCVSVTTNIRICYKNALLLFCPIQLRRWVIPRTGICGVQSGQFLENFVPRGNNVLLLSRLFVTLKFWCWKCHWSELPARQWDLVSLSVNYASVNNTSVWTVSKLEKLTQKSKSRTRTPKVTVGLRMRLDEAWPFVVTH